MATMNPLEQKARSSFIKGFVIALLIGIIISGFLGYRIYFMKKAEEERLKQLVDVYVLTSDVKSGESMINSTSSSTGKSADIVTKDLFTKKKIDKSVIPADATSMSGFIDRFYLTDKDGNPIVSAVDESTGLLFPGYKDPEDGITYEVQQEVADNGTRYFYIKDYDGLQQRVDLELNQQPYIAKIDLKKNTIVTPSMFTASDEKITADMRTIEFSMISLPYDLENGATIDIRLRLSTGADYIVLSKKRVTIPKTSEGMSTNTIQLSLSEGEILTMNAASVDAYRIEGCKFYALKYTDPGMQTAATLTYAPSEVVLHTIEKDPNIVQEARNALITNYSSNYQNSRKAFEDALSAVDTKDQQDAVITGTASEIKNEDKLRETYLSGASEDSSTSE